MRRERAGKKLKAIILYSSAHGSTAVCANKIAEALDGQAQLEDLKHLNGFDPEKYDFVIIGTPIYGGSALKEVKTFCNENAAGLLKKPLAVFFSCLSENEKDIDSFLKQNFPPELVTHISVCSALGGAFYFTKLNFMERLVDKALVKAYAKSAGIPTPDGKTDFITISDEKITKFAEKIEAEGAANDF